MIRAWGDWQLFQELLATMDSIAKKHKVGPLGLLLCLVCWGSSTDLADHSSQGDRPPRQDHSS